MMETDAPLPKLRVPYNDHVFLFGDSLCMHLLRSGHCNVNDTIEQDRRRFFNCFMTNKRVA